MKENKGVTNFLYMYFFCIFRKVIFFKCENFDIPFVVVAPELSEVVVLLVVVLVEVVVVVGGS